jgi:hypothetical protein
MRLEQQLRQRLASRQSQGRNHRHLLPMLALNLIGRRLAAQGLGAAHQGRHQ